MDRSVQNHEGIQQNTGEIEPEHGEIEPDHGRDRTRPWERSVHDMGRRRLGFTACSNASGRAPHGHARLFADSRCSPDCGEEGFDQECWFPLRPYALT